MPTCGILDARDSAVERGERFSHPVRAGGGVALALLPFAAPAMGARPDRGGDYLGFSAQVSEGPEEGLVNVSAELEVSRDARRLAVALTLSCRRRLADVQLPASGKAGGRGAVRVGRDGRFAVGGLRA